MLQRQLCKSLKLLGCATKLTFAQGHGYTLKEVELMEKERKGHVKKLRSKMRNQWHIPNHILDGQAFSYETELFAFMKRIGCNSSYITESSRVAGENSVLSSALVVVLSHHSTSNNEELNELKADICAEGKVRLTSYLMQYFKHMFPNLGSEILYKLSAPETCLSQAKCYSLYKHLCLHELIRSNSHNPLTLEEYSDVLGGIFLSILLFDENSFISVPLFLQSCILNYYSQLDFRNIIDYDNLALAEKKLNECLNSRGKCSPEIRIISIDGEKSPVPTFNMGVFLEDECIGSAADVSVETASLHAFNAASTNLMLSEMNSESVINSIDFGNLPEKFSQKKLEYETKLTKLLQDVDLSQLEIAKRNGRRTIRHHFKDFESLKDLRKMRYE